ncbi:hypothetical protein RRF57_004867 [Xylaria bambusicola]|uniref:Uncharacterized protein n=1 Tax=Xylaria bambusicola TaxID=326684 RepID=A0AAN7Z4Q2_9PEZI
MARDEFQHSARHSVERIARKVSNKSLDSKCSHESSDDELLEARDKDARSTSAPASPSPSLRPVGSETGHTPSQRGLAHVYRDDTGRNLLEGANLSYNHTPRPNKSAGLTAPRVLIQSSSADNLAIPTESAHRGTSGLASPDKRQHEAGEDDVTSKDHVETNRARERQENPTR